MKFDMPLTYILHGTHAVTIYNIILRTLDTPGHNPFFFRKGRMGQLTPLGLGGHNEGPNQAIAFGIRL